MNENNLEQWIVSLKEEWERQKKEGTYSDADWKSFLIWYVSEDVDIHNSIIESWKEDQRVDE